MAYDSNWQHDFELENDLKKYVSQNMKRKEVFDFVKRDFPQYSWSMRSLDRRLQHFSIKYINYDVNIRTIQDAVKKEIEGPGQLLGYRAMNAKLRTIHDIKVPRNLVYTVMQDIDPAGLEKRSLDKKKKKKKVAFESEGPLFLISLDGHDKLCGYQNSTFPIAVYGCLDTFSRKILFIFVCESNSNPKIIGRRYFDYLYNTQQLPTYMRIDKGNETGKMAAIHVYMHSLIGVLEDPVDTVIFGPSTSNKIERWWRELHERLETFFKEQLCCLLRGGEYDPQQELHKKTPRVCVHTNSTKRVRRFC